MGESYCQFHVTAEYKLVTKSHLTCRRKMTGLPDQDISTSPRGLWLKDFPLLIDLDGSYRGAKWLTAAHTPVTSMLPFKTHHMDTCFLFLTDWMISIHLTILYLHGGRGRLHLPNGEEWDQEVEAPVVCNELLSPFLILDHLIPSVPNSLKYVRALEGSTSSVSVS